MIRPASVPPHVLREYAFLADGWRGALIGPRGDIGWMCAPTWESDAVFANLLGGRGLYAVTPTDARNVWGGYYEPGSLIWTSRWITGGGIIECQEALAFPGDRHRAVLIRRIHAVDGDAAVTVTLDPRAGFGRRPWTDVHRAGGAWTGRTGRLRVRWTGAPRARHDSTGILRTALRVAAGEHHDLILEISDRPLDEAVPDPDKAWRATRAAWSAGVPDLAGVIGHRDAVHAHTVLRGLTVPGGGMVAAATTSIPERAESGRNYDYRFAWIRDQCYAGEAAAAAGADDLLDASVSFVGAQLREHGAQMAPAYLATSGAAVPDEVAKSFLPGYPGGKVKTGNWVNGQFQLDAFGESLLLLAAAAGRNRLDTDGWKALVTAAGVVEDRWQRPDAGIWELQPAQWTHSMLTCVAGLKAAAGIAPTAQASAWTGLADQILAHTARTAVHPSGRWQRTSDDPRIDAALLMPGIRGALPADDPRSAATLAAVHSELQDDGYVYRYRADARPLGDAEGAFLLCGLATALATHQAGNPVDAVRWFERSRTACGPAGLYCEEYDVRQRQLRGNLPQAFVHAMLLECAVRLSIA